MSPRGVYERTGDLTRNVHGRPRYEVKDGCWLWLGATTAKGYGTIAYREDEGS